MRQFYLVDKPGSLRALKWKTSDVPTIGNGQVLVEVKALGLNYADLFAIMGLYSATPKEPFIPGLEFCGVVADSNSTRFSVGERVMGITKFGGYDSHIVGDSDYLIPLASSWTFEQGAAFLVQTLTAYYALVSLGNLQHGQTVLIHSAAGGVGIQAHRIAKKFDAFTIGVVGDQSKISILEQEGYDRTLVRGKFFRQELAEALAGKELNLVLEATGGKYFRYSYDALAPMGRLVSYGSAQFTPQGNQPNYFLLLFKYLFRPRVDPLSMITANKSVMAFNLIWLYERQQLLHSLLAEIEALQLAPPRIGHTFSFNKLPDALLIFKKGMTTGKVVVCL